MSRIGVNGFENPLRDAKTEEFKKQIGSGAKLKMDDTGMGSELKMDDTCMGCKLRAGVLIKS